MARLLLATKLAVRPENQCASEGGGRRSTDALFSTGERLAGRITISHRIICLQPSRRGATSWRWRFGQVTRLGQVKERSR